MLDIAHVYRGAIEHSIREVISQPRYRNTGEGLASLVVEVVEGNDRKLPVIQIQVADHIMRLGSNGLQWNELPNIKNLLAWARHKEPSSEKAAQKLAWAVAWDKKKNDTWKPKAWRKKSLSAVLKEMNHDMIRSFEKAVLDDIMKEARKGLIN